MKSRTAELSPPISPSILVALRSDAHSKLPAYSQSTISRLEHRAAKVWREAFAETGGVS